MILCERESEKFHHKTFIRSCSSVHERMYFELFDMTFYTLLLLLLLLLSILQINIYFHSHMCVHITKLILFSKSDCKQHLSSCLLSNLFFLLYFGWSQSNVQLELRTHTKWFHFFFSLSLEAKMSSLSVRLCVSVKWKKNIN